MIFVLFNVWLIEVDGERDMTARAIWRRVLLEGPHIILCALPAELMMTTRPNGLFSRLIADTAYQHILPAFGMFLED